MFKINNDDMSIYITRGDALFFGVRGKDKDGKDYTFVEGDLLRIRVFKKKDCTDVVIDKEFPVTSPGQVQQIYLSGKETKIKDVISKPVDYWYEVELNPFTDPQTIIGYDEDGPKLFRLFPEGADKEGEGSEQSPVPPEQLVELTGYVINPDVIRGKSAYEIAVMYGFEGTEEEWIKAVTAEANRSKEEAERAENAAAAATVERIASANHASDAMSAARRATEEANRAASEAQAALDSKADKGNANENTEVVYTKDIPSNSAPYAKINKIGGMTRKSTNLILPYSNLNSSYGITFEENSDGSITVNGTATNDVYKKVGDVKLYAGQTHFLSGSPTGSSWSTYCMYVSSSYPDLGKGVAFTPSSTQGSLNIFIKSGTTLTNVTFYPMLNEGSTALPYEPYFEGLRSAPVTEVESVGANIWDEEWEVGGYNGNGVAQDYATTIRSKPNNYIKVVPNTAYYAKTNGANIYICQYDANYNFIAYVSSSGIADTTFTTNSQCHYLRFQMGSAYGTTYKNDICINKSNEAINGKYYPYTKNTFAIPEERQNLDGYGWGVNDTCYNYIDFEKKQFIQRVEKVVFDGSADEIWFKYNTTNTYIIELTRRKKAIQCAVCDKFTYKKNCWDSPDVSGAYCDHPTLPNVYFNTEFATPSEFRAWLAENPTTLYYELETPIITDISDILPADNFIGVEGGGTITFKNEFGYAVPSDMTLYVNANELIGAKQFVGDLIGTANHAKKASNSEKDSKNNVIVDYYASKARVASLEAMITSLLERVSSLEGESSGGDTPEDENTIKIGTNLRGKTVVFTDMTTNVGKGHETYFQAGDFEIYSDNDVYNCTANAYGFFGGTGYGKNFIYSFSDYDNYIVTALTDNVSVTYLEDYDFGAASLVLRSKADAYGNQTVFKVSTGVFEHLRIDCEQWGGDAENSYYQSYGEFSSGDPYFSIFDTYSFKDVLLQVEPDSGVNITFNADYIEVAFR